MRISSSLDVQRGSPKALSILRNWSIFLFNEPIPCDSLRLKGCSIFFSFSMDRVG